jgi:hypothetical protein
MIDDAVTDEVTARLVSAQLATADLVEAGYRGTDLALAGFVGRRALWVVVKAADQMALLSPQPLPQRLRQQPPVVPLIDLEAPRRAGNLLDDR